MAKGSNVATPEVPLPSPVSHPVRLTLPPPLVSARPSHPPALSGRRVRMDLPALLLGSVILWFAFVHIRLWFAHPDQPVGLGLVVLELIQGTLFFVRRREPRRRQPLNAWFTMTVGSWAALAVRPAGAAFFHAPALFGTRTLLGTQWPWLALQLAGTLAAIMALSTLGRSFGLLPGNRGVRTGGVYRIVRHPAYAAYLLTDLGYLLESLSLWNIAILGITLIAQLWRIRLEEAALCEDPAYRAYRAQVRYRLVPRLY